MTTAANKYITELQKRGPAAWAQGPHGWIGADGQPVTLEPWQVAVLDSWNAYKASISTLGISNVKKTGKTFVNAVLLAWRWLALPGQHFAAGNDLDQSQARQFQEITDMVQRNPFLAENVKIGKTELEFTLTGSKLTALAADATGNAGANHLTASHTESWGILHEAGIRSWEELTPPPGLSYGLPALRVADSYAGFMGESQTWHKLVDRGLKAERVSKDWPIYLTGGLLLFHMEGDEAQERCFRGTKAQRVAYYAEQAESLRPNAYSRMHENRRTSGESAFVTTEQWEACYSNGVRPIYDGEQVRLSLGADASQKHDYTALVGTTRDEDGYTVVRYVRVWKPKKFRLKNQPIDLEQTIGAEVLRLHKLGQVASVCLDVYQLAVLAQQWRRAGISCIEMPQTNQRTEADTALYDTIVAGRLRHFNNSDLNEAVQNAVTVETPRGIRIAKEKASKKIDALVALSMSNHAAVMRVSGEAESYPGNPFYDGTDFRDYIKIGNKQVYVPRANHELHPPGVTWRTCRHRNKGCEACIAELTAEGEFERQRQELEMSLARGAGIPLSAEEAAREFASNLPSLYLQGQREQKEYQDAQFIQKFWKAVRGKLGS